jgi:hypothetical protein
MYNLSRHVKVHGLRDEFLLFQKKVAFLLKELFILSYCKLIISENGTELWFNYAHKCFYSIFLFLKFTVIRDLNIFCIFIYLYFFVLFASYKILCWFLYLFFYLSSPSLQFTIKKWVLINSYFSIWSFFYDLYAVFLKPHYLYFTLASGECSLHTSTVTIITVIYLCIGCGLIFWRNRRYMNSRWTGLHSGINIWSTHVWLKKDVLIRRWHVKTTSCGQCLSYGKQN